MGNCLQTFRGDPPPYPHDQPNHFQVPQFSSNQMYPAVPTAPPPYVEVENSAPPQIVNGRRSVRHVQNQRPSLFTQQALNQTQTKILVAAIDFGTTFTGYAFSFRHEYEMDKLKISTNLWPHNSGLSTKAPSAVLISSANQVVAFGYEAQKKYADLLESGNGSNYMFFQKFKMVLYTTENLNYSTPIYDVTGKHQMRAVDVFGLVIDYLRNHLVQRLKSRDNQTALQEDMIQWVLTVPAIWHDKAKQFMRRAAEKGGIKSENLTLALEPEVASIYCRHIPQCISTSDSATMLEPGTKYLILDLGGGTVDVTVHEILPDGALQEVHHATGGCWGGATVDNDFRELIISVFGSNVMEEACEKFPNEVLDLFLEFEMKKRMFEPNQSASLALKCPACLYDIYNEINGVTIQENIQNNPMKSVVEFKRDKIYISVEGVKNLFDKSVSQIVNHVNGLLHLPEVTGVTALLLVGGYSDSYVIRDAIVSIFTHLRIIHPDDCSLSVLKGAVLFGHDPTIIKSRVCKFTYGIVINKIFLEGIHPEDKRIHVNGQDVCDDIFDIHLKKGERIELGKPRPERAYYAPFTGSVHALLEVYASTEENPTFVTDNSCTFLGSLVIELSNDPGEKSTDQIVNVSFHYCGTELEVAAREEKTRRTMKAKFDFLG